MTSRLHWTGVAVDKVEGIELGNRLLSNAHAASMNWIVLVMQSSGRFQLML
ncbi:MAG: hypothetical protein KDA75_10280 [Planctomycetaceae bacterium]|nr:hypothetical protein [Planctomycetaceae bacterium]